MKILMSAFACCPGRGSEEGVGWNWAVEATRQGHEVTVLTQVCHRKSIEEEIAKGDLPDELRFDFIMPAWLERIRALTLKTGFDGISDHTTHLLWQFVVLSHVKKNYQTDDFDIVHHITYGGIRHPTLLGKLPIPLVLGPIGGGERAPYRLRKSYGWGGWCYDLLRDIHTWSLKLDPITRGACSDAIAIYVQTTESKQALPASARQKTALHLEIGTHKVKSSLPPIKKNGRLKLIYAGRLLYWKGMNLGLRSVAEARRMGVDLELTIVGSGPQEREWRELAGKLGIEDIVTWRGWVPQIELNEMYRTHDALLFPSMHDSSGNVVLEAFINGLPVICLDLGGPAEMVNSSCGRVVPVAKRNADECVMGLAGAIAEIGALESLHRQLQKGALVRARHFTWNGIIRTFYADVERRLKGQSPAISKKLSNKILAEQ